MLPPPPGPDQRSFFGDLPQLTHDWLGYMGQCVQRHGPIVRFKTPWPLAPIVLLTEPAHIEQVLKDPARYRKGVAQRIGKPILGNGLILSEGDVWRRQRRMAVPAFHRTKIAAYAQQMSSAAEQMIDGWGDGAREVLSDITRTTVRVVARTLFGADGSAQAEDAALGLADAMAGFDAYFNSRFPLALPLPTRAGLRIQRAARRLERVVYRFIAQRRATLAAHREEDAGDLLTLLLRARDEEDGSAFSEGELRDMAINLFGAGFETTAITLGWTFYLLARHPELAARVRAEARRVAGSAPIGLEHVAQLTLTEQAVKESMRLFPAAWLIPREALEDVEIGGYRIARGTQLFICTYLVQRDARWFPEPERFDPARWTEAFARALPKLAYLPFGGGQRVCIGNTFALLDLVITTAAVARRVRFELTEREPEPHVSFLLRPRGGVHLRIEKASVFSVGEECLASSV
jgi:cytochrome P450